jgi:hypothetical protein
MNQKRGSKFVPAAVIAGAVGLLALSNGCSAVSNAVQAAQGCDEFQGGASSVASLSIDAKTKAFVTAAADLQAISASMEAAVFASCKNIATDLGVADTWSAMSGLDAQTTEACNQASTKISGILSTAQTAGVAVTLSISGGECTVNASAQINCEGSCKADASCTEPSVTVRCSPGDLSGQCSGTCNAMATCEGSVSAEANCQGSCEADCDGSCTGSASAQVDCNGTCSGNCNGTCGGTAQTTGTCSGTCEGKCDAMCTAAAGVKLHCSGTCSGKCTGNCTLAAMSTVMCGASVNCKGGCSVAYTAPTCEGKLTPPMCMGDANCQASCSSDAELTATCTPPTVSLEVVGTASADLTALVTTIQTNLPAIIQVFKTQGKLALDGATNVVSTGSAVVSEVTSLGGKALACATVAAQASASASVSVNVSVMASASVSGSAGAGS